MAHQIGVGLTGGGPVGRVERGIGLADPPAPEPLRAAPAAPAAPDVAAASGASPLPVAGPAAGPSRGAPAARQPFRTSFEKITSNPLGTIGLLLTSFAEGMQGRGPETLLNLQERSRKEREARIAEIGVQSDMLRDAVGQLKRLPEDQREAFVRNFGARAESVMPGSNLERTLRGMSKSLPSAEKLLRLHKELEEPMTAVCGADVECLQKLATDSAWIDLAYSQIDKRHLPIVEQKLELFGDVIAGAAGQLLPDQRNALVRSLPTDADGNLALSVADFEALNRTLPESVRLSAPELAALRRQVKENPGFAARHGFSSNAWAAEEQKIQMETEALEKREQIKARFRETEEWSEPFEDQRGNLVQRDKNTGQVRVLDKAPEATSPLVEGGVLKSPVSGEIRRQVAVQFGGTLDPRTGEISILDPQKALDAQAVNERAEGLIITGEEMSVGAAVARAMRDMGIEIPEIGAAQPAAGGEAADTEREAAAAEIEAGTAGAAQPARTGATASRDFPMRPAQPGARQPAPSQPAQLGFTAQDVRDTAEVEGMTVDAVLDSAIENRGLNMTREQLKRRLGL